MLTCSVLIFPTVQCRMVMLQRSGVILHLHTLQMVQYKDVSSGQILILSELISICLLTTHSCTEGWKHLSQAGQWLSRTGFGHPVIHLPNKMDELAVLR